MELPRTCRRATARQRAGLSNELAGPTRQWRFLSKLACILQYMILCSILRADLRPTTMWQFASIPSLLSRWGIWEGLSINEWGLGESRPLVTYEPVKFEKQPVEVQDFKKTTHHLEEFKEHTSTEKPERCQHATGWTWKHLVLNR